MVESTFRGMKEPITALCLREVDLLFRPFLHRKINFSSRLVMTRLMQIEESIDEKLRYYTARLPHQIGLIIAEPVAVNESSAAGPVCRRGFVGGENLRAWRRLCRVVHAGNCRIAAQLCHAGMLRQNDDAIGPSGIDPLTKECRGETMTRARIREVVQAFGAAAALARQIGFDAVEIQGGQDFLIHQFLCSETNRRHDEYGGDAVARTRFACEVIHAVRKAVGRRFPVIFCYSFGGSSRRLVSTPAELAAILRLLCEAGVDIFACRGEGALEPAFSGSPLSAAGWTRLLTQRPVITESGAEVPGFSLRRLAYGLQSGEYDMVAVGRTLLSDVEWGSKVRRGDI